MSRLPTPYGVRQLQLEPGSDRAPLRMLPPRAQDSFAALSADYEFFTPALLYLYGNVTNAVWADLAAQFPGLEFYVRKFDQPVFDGLTDPRSGDRGWNFGLFAVPRHFAEHLWRHLANAKVLDPVTSVVYSYHPQEVRVADPFALDRERIVTDKVPVVSLTSFGVSDGANRWQLVEAPEPRLGRPCLWKLKSAGRTAAFAKALLAGDNPLAEGVKDAWRSALSRLRQRNMDAQIRATLPGGKTVVLPSAREILATPEDLLRD